AKNQRNLLKHHLRFETAALAFDDPYALTQRDESSDEEERLDHFWSHWSGHNSCGGPYLL
ncbi:MAG: BrnT family toxin, partial [Candidatus Sulfotelmatobacter sp.]